MATVVLHPPHPPFPNKKSKEEIQYREMSVPSQLGKMLLGKISWTKQEERKTLSQLLSAGCTMHPQLINPSNSYKKFQLVLLNHLLYLLETSNNMELKTHYLSLQLSHHRSRKELQRQSKHFYCINASDRSCRKADFPPVERQSWSSLNFSWLVTGVKRRFKKAEVRVSR